MLLYAAYNQPVKFALTGHHQVKYPGWMLKRNGLILWTTFEAMHAKVNNEGKPNIKLQGIIICRCQDGFLLSTYCLVQLLSFFFFSEDMKRLPEWGFWLWSCLGLFSFLFGGGGGGGSEVFCFQFGFMSSK